MTRITQLLPLCLATLPAVLAATKFSAVGVPVSNLKQSVAFYTKTLGFTAYRTITVPDYEETILVIPNAGAGQTSLVLMQYTNGRNVTNLPGKLVFNVENVTTSVAGLEAAGALVLSRPGTLKIGNVTLPTAFVRDLDGHLVELNPLDMKF